jgi:hypothetical protein
MITQNALREVRNMKNPFQYGGVVRGDAFCNRKKEVEDLLRAMENIRKLGVTHLKAPVKRKKYSVSKKKRFSRENDAAARMGHPLARRSRRHLISPCGSRSYLFPTLHGSLRFFSLKIITIEPSTSFPVP